MIATFRTLIAQTAINLPWKALAISSVVLYPILCSLFRYQRRDSLKKKFPYADRTSMSKMTITDAHDIMGIVSDLEFPAFFKLSLQFALFKTYGIPTISKLLMSTTEFSTKEKASKRLADTSVLIGEFLAHSPTSERAIKAIARMNYIHSPYQKSGKISQNDLLFTLSVFVLEPIRWVNDREWRTLTEMEICAIGTFWKSVGDAMGVDFSKLKRSSSGWKDGLEFKEDLEEWANAYEKKEMVPKISNRKTADETTALLLYHIPLSLKPVGEKFVAALLPPRLREAMMYDTPPQAYITIANTVFTIRKYFLRYLSLPRPSFMAVRRFSASADPKTGRYYYKEYTAHPYYNKPGFLNRWGPNAWLIWALGGDVPGSKGDLYIPQGYKFQEVGPKALMSKGLDVTDATEARLHLERQVGCPFAFVG